MLNLLGDLWLRDGDERPVPPPWDAVLAFVSAPARDGGTIDHHRAFVEPL